MVERCIYILLLHTEQLHVLVLDNGHLQVVHESLSKHLYKHIYIYGLLTYTGKGGGGCKVGMRSRMSERLGRVGCIWRAHAVIKLCLSLL